MNRPNVRAGTWLCHAGVWGLVQAVVWTGQGWAADVVTVAPLGRARWLL